MDVDTVWQWSMRLWFLIKAKKEADRHRLSGWERKWRMGVGLQGISLCLPLTLWAQWPVFPTVNNYPFPPKHLSLSEHHVYTKIQESCYRNSCGSRWDGIGEAGLGPVDGGGSRGGLWGCVINPWGKSRVMLTFKASQSRESTSIWIRGRQKKGPIVTELKLEVQLHVVLSALRHEKKSQGGKDDIKARPFVEGAHQWWSWTWLNVFQCFSLKACYAKLRFKSSSVNERPALQCHTLND